MSDLASGAYFLDLDPDCFQFVVEHLHGEMVSLDKLTPAEREETERLFTLFNLGNRPALPDLKLTKAIPSFANDLSIPT